MIILNQDTLRIKSKVTTREEVEKLDLVNLLQKANKTGWIKGLGLSAIQIGIPLRFAWYRYEESGRSYEGQLLNPVIVKKYGLHVADEGCLSIPNKYIKVERAWAIEYLNNNKKQTNHAIGLLARIIQHEVDHMDGILMIDKEIK
jgi:peptide deformylase